MRTVVRSLRAAPRSLAAAAALTLIEALTLLGLAGFLIVKGAVDDAQSLFGVVGGAALALAGAVALAGVTPWLIAGARWARSPVVVLQILWLPVGFSLAFQAGRPEIGGPLLAVAVTVLVLLGRAESRSAFDSGPGGEVSDAGVSSASRVRARRAATASARPRR